MKAFFFILFFFTITIVSCVAQSAKDTIQRPLYPQKNDTTKIKLLIQTAWNYSNKGLYQEAYRYALESEKVSLILNENSYLQDNYFLLGRITNHLSQFDKSIMYYNKSLQIAERDSDKFQMTRCYMELANVYGGQLLVEKTFEYNMKGLKLAEELGDEMMVANIKANLVIVYLYQENYEEALRNQIKSLATFEKYNDKTELSIAYHNLGEIFYHKKNYELALHYYLKSIRITDSIGNIDEITTTLISISETYILLNNYNKAQEYALKALRKAKESDDKTSIFQCYELLGRTNLKNGNLVNAETNMEKALILVDSIEDKELLSKFYMTLSELKEGSYDFKSSLRYYKIYKSYRDSIFSDNANRRIIEMSAKYESRQKDKEIKLLNAENELKGIELEQKRTNQRIFFFGSITMFVVIGFATYLFFMRSRQKQRSAYYRELIQSQEYERIRISRDLHDSVGQSLLFLKMQSVGEQRQLIDTIIEELRTISRELHPVKFINIGMQKLLINLIERAKSNSSIFFTYDIEDVIIDDINTKINLYRIVQESIGNIIKHSKAQNARVILVKDKTKLKITIIDDGKGFETSRFRSNSSLGLVTMKERAILVGGELKISSNKNGTKIEVILNL